MVELGQTTQSRMSGRTGVGANVLLQVRQLCELFLADVAVVGLDAQVDTHVLGEIGGVGKGLDALRAPVRLGLAHVALTVLLELGFRLQHLHTESEYK